MNKSDARQPMCFHSVFMCLQSLFLQETDSFHVNVHTEQYFVQTMNH
jgi:hypothetical protein